MRSLPVAVDEELVWVRPHMWRRRYELRVGGEPAATLVWPTKLRSRAVATAADGEWSFARTGYWPNRVSVWRAGTEPEFARFEAGWTGSGLLLVDDGETFFWQPGNFWRTRWGWHDAAGSRLIGFRRRTSFLRLQVEGVVELEAAPPDLFGVLVCLGWYLVVLTGDAGGGVSAGAARVGTADGAG